LFGNDYSLLLETYDFLPEAPVIVLAGVFVWGKR